MALPFGRREDRARTATLAVLGWRGVATRWKRTVSRTRGVGTTRTNRAGHPAHACRAVAAGVSSPPACLRVRTLE